MGAAIKQAECGRQLREFDLLPRGGKVRLSKSISHEYRRMLPVKSVGAPLIALMSD
jgi:hypothetical protein